MNGECTKGQERCEAARCHPEPFAVILSAAKNLRSSSAQGKLREGSLQFLARRRTNYQLRRSFASLRMTAVYFPIAQDDRQLIFLSTQPHAVPGRGALNSNPSP